MRINLPAKVKECQMCKKPAYDASGRWHIIKIHRMWGAFDFTLSIISAHIICDKHGAQDLNTIHVIDG